MGQCLIVKALLSKKKFVALHIKKSHAFLPVISSLCFQNKCDQQ